MSRAWMPMYWGDYLRDTRDLTTLQHGAYLLLIAHYWQHGCVPKDDRQLSTIAGLSLKAWNRIKGPIRAKWADDWSHKRIDKEIEKLCRKGRLWQEAGRKGGLSSGRRRTISSGERLIEQAEEAKRTLKRTLAFRLSGNEADAQAETKRTSTNQISNTTSFFSCAAREEEVGDSVPARTLATALPAGALAPAPDAEGDAEDQPAVTKPCDVSRSELEQMFAARRSNGAAS